MLLNNPNLCESNLKHKDFLEVGSLSNSSDDGKEPKVTLTRNVDGEKIIIIDEKNNKLGERSDETEIVDIPQDDTMKSKSVLPSIAKITDAIFEPLKLNKDENGVVTETLTNDIEILPSEETPKEVALTDIATKNVVLMEIANGIEERSLIPKMQIDKKMKDPKLKKLSPKLIGKPIARVSPTMANGVLTNARIDNGKDRHFFHP